MPGIEISKDTFEHALKKLNTQEIQSIFEDKDNINIDSKKSKEEMIIQLLEEVDKGKITGEMYVEIREQAFSISKNFYDGFFYKIDDVFKDIEIDNFKSKLLEKAEGSKKDKKVSIINIHHSNRIIQFTFKQSNKSLYYDSESRLSTACKQLVDVDVIMDFETQLLYVHSKNCIDTKKIITFINSTLLMTLSEQQGKKKRFLSEPKFDIGVAEKWYEDNKKTLSFRVENMTIQMLDLLFCFDAGEEEFSNLGVKTIYLKDDIIYTSTDTATITDVRFGGENLQHHSKIIEEIRNGKRILGFKIEADYLYCDPDTDDEVITRLPITFLYDEKSYLRVTINTGILLQIKEDILREAYGKIKRLFINKFTSDTIFNTDQLIAYLNQQIVEDVAKVAEETKEIPTTDEQLKNTKWSL